MKVLLLERIKKLGNIGDSVEVTDGFARNYLLTKKKAIRFTKENEEEFNKQKTTIEQANSEKRNLALKNSKTLEGKILTVIRQAGDDGRLYGSVSNKDIVNLIKSNFKVAIPVENITLDQKIKAIGLYNVIASLYPEIESTISLNVARSLEEATSVIGIDKREKKQNDIKSTATKSFEQMKVANNTGTIQKTNKN